MAIVVEHVKTKNRYVLLGSGFGAYKASRPGILGPVDDEGRMSLLAVSDSNGTIKWFSSEEMRVVEVDRRLVRDILTPFHGQESDTKLCPECRSVVISDAKECPNCGKCLK